MIDSDAVLDTAYRLKSAGVPFALATVVRCESPTSAKPGAKAVIEPDGTIHGWIGGGCAQPAVVKTARQAIADGLPRLIRISPERGEPVESGIVEYGMSCHSGGTLDIFIDPVNSRPALAIIGASAAAQALCALASRMGFAVTAVCPGANRELFPEAEQTIDGLELPQALRDRRPFVVVSTQGRRDEEGLEAALRSGAPSIAFIASERKAAKLRQYLLERGHDGARVEAIVSPAGVEIGAVTPEEIALSVLAGLVRARRSPVEAEPAGAQATAAAAPETAVQAIDPVCGMSVDIATAAYRTEHAGQRYYFCCAHCQHSFEQAPERYLAAARETP
jgi:xanthine dehydrogenase accessory factor